MRGAVSRRISKKGTRRRGPAAVHITAGRWKRRRLEVPVAARPTAGRAREALFDILQKRVPGSRVLDLFAGSGAVGLEAISRGAARAVLVEKDSAALERNLARLPAGDEVELIQLEAGEALRELARRGDRFDIVFADPPYRVPIDRETLLGVARVLKEDGTFVLQTDSDAETPAPGSLGLRSRRPYGRNVFWFFGRCD